MITTGPFVNLEPQNPSIDIFKVHKVFRSTLKLGNGQLGWKCIRRNMHLFDTCFFLSVLGVDAATNINNI